jgi:hypothetical protein
MTTSTDTQPLAVGDRVSFRGALATVVEIEEHEHRNGSEHALRLLKYDDGQDLSDGYSWGDSDRGPGRYWWVAPDNANLERVAPEPYAPKLGDRVTVRRFRTGASADGANRAQGRIYATYNTPVSEVWVGSVDNADQWAYPIADVVAAPGHAVADDVPEGTRGRWFSVSLVQPDTSEDGPSEAVEAPAESPEAEAVGAHATASNEPNPEADSAQVAALKAQLSAAEGRESTLKHVIQSMERDLAIIGDSLKETAERQEWCGEYERHLEQLLGKLSGYSDDILREHAERAQDYYTVRVTYTTTVRASSRAAAIEEVQECHDWSSYADWEAEED